MSLDQVLDRRARTRRLTQIALLVTLALVLSWFESLLPPPPVPVPIRYGLSNLAVMTALLYFPFTAAFLVLCSKALFALVLRGLVAGLLSFAGGLLSLLGMALLLSVFRRRVSYLLLSVWGALLHNLGQFLVILLFYVGASFQVVYPFLLIMGLLTGGLTALLLRLLLVALRRGNMVPEERYL